MVTNAQTPPSPPHPAKFSPAVLDTVAPLLGGLWTAVRRSGARVDRPRVLDPFAGVGVVHSLGLPSVGVEIEPEWASAHRQNIVGDALRLPFADATFDAIVTSPCYGNRMADHHVATERCKDCLGTGGWGGSTCAKCGGAGRNTYKRLTYTHQLGRQLHPNNSGKMQWGKAYREFHERAWREVIRVLRPGGRFILNVSDHIRKGEVVPVTLWHSAWLASQPELNLVNRIKVETPRMRFGENHAARVDYESVLVFDRKDTDA